MDALMNVNDGLFGLMYYYATILLKDMGILTALKCGDLLMY